MKSRYSRTNSLGVASNASSTRSLSKKNSKTNSIYSSRSKSIDRNTLAGKKSFSDSKFYKSKYERSSSTIRNNSTKNSRNNSLSNISYSSSRQTVKPVTTKRSTSKVTKSRNSSLSSIKYNRDTSIGRRTNISNLSHSTIQSKHVTNSKLYKQPSKLTKSTSSVSSSRNLSNNVPKRSSSEIKTKSKYDEKERVIIKKTTGYDDELVQENDTVDYESRYGKLYN